MVRANKCRQLRRTRHAARMEEDRNAFKTLTGKLISTRPLGRSRHRWKDNFRIDFKGISVNARNRVDPVHNGNYWRSLVNGALNFRVP